MATSKDYIESIKIKFNGMNEVLIFPMMGEYLIKYKGKVVGGICDNRFLVKNIPSAKQLLPDAALELPYPGAKLMLRVDDETSVSFLMNLFESMYDELPEPKKKKLALKRNQNL